MIEYIEWVMSNKVLIVQAYLALVGFASIVIKLTPTLKDDAILKKLVSFTGKYLALNRK